MTGNLRECAEMKLKSAGINTDIFKRNGILFGGFGNDHIDRPKLVEKAIERAHLEIDAKLNPSDFIVIGDTPKDMHCGHVNNVPGVAIATGIFDLDGLKDCSDAVLENFTDIEKTLATFRTVQYVPRSVDYNYDKNVTE